MVGFSSTSKNLCFIYRLITMWEFLYLVSTVTDLNNTVTSTCDHQASRWVHVHVGDVVFPLVERGQRCSTTTHTQRQSFIRVASEHWGVMRRKTQLWPICNNYLHNPFTHSSSLMVSKHSSHTRTGNSKPMIGNVERLELHFPHTALPHFLQWCCTQETHPWNTDSSIYAKLTVVQKNLYSYTLLR